MPGTLHLIATPIGNLEDITLRALRILRDEVALIACEDTRQTEKLLGHYGIRKPLISYHEHNEASRTAQLVERLEGGESIALVSDAGTPLVSDPGYRLVTRAIERGFPVVPIPGPCAIVTALAGSGLPTDEFRFIGFLPAKAAARRRVLQELRNEQATVIAYETPHRILDCLADVEELLGDRPLVIARELTKIHEEFVRGNARTARDQLARRPSVKGEITLLIGKSETAEAVEDPAAEVEKLQGQGVDRMQAIKMVAKRVRVPKRDLYRRCEERGSNPPDRPRR
ncbi:MAG: 16S rRNA (cytidine(1402)-2'-O)-methyltransferase [Acidobacteriaceae bacterium]|nr:16S rRNA (cytidine(1402)-2'-O)-methyltransferase [Acidobacteriaceae bacterium]